MGNQKKIVILIVDDDPKVRELIQAFFSMKNDLVSCVMASDAQQAVLKMSNQEFDLVLVDNIMPGRTGMDFAVSLRKSIKYARIPIILMSGSFQQEDVVKAIDAGLKDILVKPFSLKQLNEKIAHVLKKYAHS
ncbi:MAG: response regulator [Bacteriovorax sp.]